MNAVFLFIIGIPLIEIYLMIKVGGVIGPLNTIFLIFFTAVVGIYFARLEGLNAVRSGFQQMIKNKMPIYEMISGAALAFAALLLIIPGFLTDMFGFLLILPITRKYFIKSMSSKEYAATTKKKRKDTKKGKQHSAQPKKIAKKTARHRK